MITNQTFFQGLRRTTTVIISTNQWVDEIIQTSFTVVNRKHPTRNSFQYFSTVTSNAAQVEASQDERTTKFKNNSTSSGPRTLPTRHSRHHAPPVAPREILEKEFDRIVSSIPGTLIAFNPQNLHQSKIEEYEHALSETFPLSQQVEYLLRGYSSLISPHSIVHLQAKSTLPYIPSIPKGAHKDDVITILNKMVQLLERMEQEGNAYVELRSKFREQLVRAAASNSEGEEGGFSSSNNRDSSSHAWKISQLVKSYGAPPGPTIRMYDLILDAIAVSISNCAGDTEKELKLLHISRDIYNRALERFELDRKAGMVEINRASCPTSLTFNAVIRAAANVKNTNKDEQVRDVAMENAFFAFDAMHHHIITCRNSATYAYILQMMNVHFPVGETRGYIAVGMWDKCLQEGVVDENVIESMIEFGDGKAHGDMFDSWFLKSIKGVWNKEEPNGFGFPVSWGENRRIRRFDKRLDLY